ncbi:MAG: tyrosine-protein kinase [Actinomycetota bacterium]|nr:tyrosine-protein kinase [Actinomycetota bacterium]
MDHTAAGLGNVLDVLRRRAATVLLVALPLLLGAVLYTQSLPDVYEATSVVALSPRANVQASADIIRVIAPKYVAYVTSRPTSLTVARTARVGAEDLRNGTDASVAPDTANLVIKVRLGDPADAAVAANALARVAVDLSKFDRLLDAFVLVPAVPVRTPAGPPRTLLDAGGLLLAILAGVTAGLVIDRARPGVSSADSLAQTTGHRTLGTVPRSRALRDVVSEALADPVIGTAVGALRVQIDSESRLLPLRVLAVTSPSSGDGKTTIASTLAIAMARLELRVLLLDADLRRPHLAEALGMGDDFGLGLAEVLEGTATLADAGRQIGPRTLRVLGTDPRDDAGTLLARRLQPLLAQARSEYDFVIVDCPPVLATDDAMTIAVHCDATLVVVTQGSSAEHAGAAVRKLDGLGARVLGCVLNRSRGGGPGGSYGSYRPFDSRPEGRSDAGLAVG